MVQIVGKYQHQKNENLDEYFKACGIPYIPRKMMCSSSPLIEIKNNESGEWTVASSTFFRNVVSTFKLGEEYEEHMPGGIIKSTTTLEENKLVTLSIAPDGGKVTRTYEFDDDGCVITLKHESSGITAKRFFLRVKNPEEQPKQ